MTTICRAIVVAILFLVVCRIDNAQAQVLPTEPDVDLAARSSTGATVPAGGSATLHVNVDSGSGDGGLLHIATTNPDVTLTLVLPTGVQVTESNAVGLGMEWVSTTESDGVFLLQLSEHARNTFIELGSNPPAGDYAIIATGSTTTVPSLVTAMFASTSNVRVGLATDSSVYRVGDRVAISALVFDGDQPVTVASVTAAVGASGGVGGSPLTLQDAGPNDAAPGDGLFSGEFVVSAPGDYVVVAKIDGTSPTGVAFSRTATKTFRVVPPRAEFASIDSATSDEDGNGLADHLNVRARLNVLVAGSYQLKASLLADSGVRAEALGTATLGTGSETILAPFTFDDVRRLGGGPITVEDVYLYFVAPPAAPEIADFREHAGNIDTYDVAQFDSAQEFDALRDLSAPSIADLPDISVTATSPSGAQVTYEPPQVSDDSDPSPRITVLPPSGSTFSIGSTVVTVTATNSAGLQTQKTFRVTVREPSDCQVDSEGLRVPNQWCSGDLFLGKGHLEYEQLRDANGQLLTNPWDGSPAMGFVVHDGGDFIVVDPTMLPQALVHDSSGSLTPAAVTDPLNHDLWTSGGPSNKITRFGAPSENVPPQVLASIDLSQYTRTSSCDATGTGCGAVGSLVFDRDGNLYVGTDSGVNRILKLDRSGALLDSYTVPLGPHGPLWLDLAADQRTMFYTSGDAIVRVFRTDRAPLTSDLFNGGVQPLTDATLDPNNLHLFGSIVVKNAANEALVEEVYHVRILPPGDGGGNLLVLSGWAALRTRLDGTHVLGVGGDVASPYRAMELSPDATSVWMLSRPTAPLPFSTISKVHIASNFPDVTPYRGDWGMLQGIAVMNGYRAATTQPNCTSSDGPLCHPLPNCAVPTLTEGCQPEGAPVLDPVADRVNLQGDHVTSIGLTARDPNGDWLEYSVSTLPAGLTFDPDQHTISGTLDWTAGSGVVNVTVTNSRGLFDRKSFSWTINYRDAPPSMTVLPEVSRDTDGSYLVNTPRGVPVTFRLFAQDPNPCDGVDFYLYNGETLPPGLAIVSDERTNPGCTPNFVYSASLTGTPTTEGTTVFTIRYPRTYRLGTFVWSVTNTAPTIDEIADQQAVVGQTFDLDLASDDENGDALTFSAEGLPSGIGINSTTGHLSGTPTVAQSDVQVTVTADDEHGGTETRTFHMTISGGLD